MTNIIKLILVIAFSTICSAGYSQNNRSLEKRKQELIQKEEERVAEQDQALKEMKAGHLAIQTKETKKRMKKSKKKANKTNKNRGSFSLKTIFKK
jgi:hypothetical protein